MHNTRAVIHRCPLPPNAANPGCVCEVDDEWENDRFLHDSRAVIHGCPSRPYAVNPGCVCEVDDELENDRYRPPRCLISYRVCIKILNEKRIEHKNLQD